MSLIIKNALFNGKHINTASAPWSLIFEEKAIAKNLDMNWYNNSNSKNINIKRSNWFHRITTRKIRGNSIASICSLPALGNFLERFLHMKLIRIVSSNKCSYSFLSKRYITFPRWMHWMYIFIKLIVIIRWI